MVIKCFVCLIVLLLVRVSHDGVKVVKVYQLWFSLNDQRNRLLNDTTCKPEVDGLHVPRGGDRVEMEYCHGP